MAVKLPVFFNQILSNENFICPLTANRWILEYRKFLFLSFFTTKQVVPSEPVHIVWKMHQGYSAHYRKSCHSIFGEPLVHAFETTF